MALGCPPRSAMEGTNGNYEPFNGRLGSYGTYGSTYGSDSFFGSPVEPQKRYDNMQLSPFITGVNIVIRELEGADKTCVKIMERLKHPDGPGSSQSDVSQCSTENTATKNPVLAIRADESMEKNVEKFTSPLMGQPVVIDLTDEDSCDSRTSSRPDQGPMDAGQVQSSPLGTSVATGITFLSDDDEEEDVNVSVPLSLNKGIFQVQEEDVNAFASQCLPTENDKLEVKADKWDPLAGTWNNMEEALALANHPRHSPTEKPILVQGSKRRKVNKGDDVSHNVSNDYQTIHYQWPDEANELQGETISMSRPKRGRGRPRKKDSSQVECRDLLETFVTPNIDHHRKQEVDEIQVDLKRVMDKKAGKEAEKEDGRSEKHKDKKVREKRQNKEELLEDEDDDEEVEPEKPGVDDLTEELLKLSSKNDEKVDYQPYVRRSYQEEQDDLEEVFNDLKIIKTSVAGPSADTMTSKTSQKGEEECEHKNFDFDDGYGYYCEDCGAIGIDMPTSESSQQKKSCDHKNFEFSDEAGIFCPDCGKVWRDIESCYVAGDMSKRFRKQTQNVPEKGAGIPQVKLNLQGTSGNEDFCGVELHLHPLFEEKMHAHQRKGFKFLSENLLGGRRGSSEQMGCVLAHAPGTGKTCLVISFIQSFLTKFPEGKPLILAPKIMLQSWENEFKTWKVQEVKIYRIGGSGGTYNCPGDVEEDEDPSFAPHVRNTLKESRAITLREWQAGRGVLLMSYKLFTNMVSNGLAENVPPESLDYQMSKVLLEVTNLVILDEGHLARNERTQISQALLAMETKRKVILSGTLFQNNFKELYTLLKLCRDDFMISHPQYQKRIAELAAYNNGPKHGNGKSNVQKKSMKEIMAIEERIFTEEIGQKLETYVKSGETRTDEIEPVVLKLQSLTPFVDWYPGEILKSLPGLHEYSVHLNLTETQEEIIARLPHSNHMSRQCSLLAACIHPSLANKDEGSVTELTLRGSSQPIDPHKGVKITFLLQLMAHCKQAKEKLLIFCSTLNPLNYIGQLFQTVWQWQSGHHILRLDGKMQDSDRQKVIVQFNDLKSRSHVLLASTKACKEGITLVGASRVVILDSQDNPSIVRQAVSRAFRIGQKKKVYVYRLVAEQKDEALIFNRSVNKERLSQVLLDPVATMARLRGFLLGDQAPEDIEDEILQKMMLNDRAKGGVMIQEVRKYNALG